ncbi:MAG TPA: hypothetical protein EYH34_15810 [Planctomycetes bacterium]|nr:hypothetical protein [Planctomycetota bacterium]
MEPVEIVRRAIHFQCPPRLPFWQHWNHKLRQFPDDVHNIWEMDRAQAGWFFDSPGTDDWGCAWQTTAQRNIGQVAGHPLEDWSRLAAYRPPNPRNPFYYERLGPLIDQAAGRYVCLTAHGLLFSRLHMLRGFANTMEDFYLHPEKVHRLLDMIVQFKLEQIDELRRRFGSRVHGLFVADDWGTQDGTFVSLKILEEFFAPRYRLIFDALHDCGWDVILHSCGKINAFVPTFIRLGVDVLNMQQTRSYGLVEFGRRFRGQVCFLATVCIQSTLVRGDEGEVRREARQLVEHWSTPRGGMIAFDYGAWDAIGVKPETAVVMFDEFDKLKYYWRHGGDRRT